MKFKKTALILSLLFAPLAITSCKTGEPISDFEIKTQMIYESAKESGAFSGTYEEWLESIKGEAGKPGKEITSIIFGGVVNNEASYNVIFNDGSLSEIKIPLVKGDKGEDGVSILSVKLTSSTEELDTYTISYSDGKTDKFTVKHGQKGDQGIQGEKGETGAQGIQGVPGEDGHSPVVTISNDGFWVIDGVKSNFVAQGPKGDRGEPGSNGVSITSIVKTNTEGLVDTYTITYSDGNTSTFTVKNGVPGEKGEQGIQGVPGKDGHTPEITISDDGYWVIDGVKSNFIARGPKGDKGDQGIQGEKGEPGQNGQDGATGPQGPAGQDGKPGKSAYELYVESHPEYDDRGEAQWLDDLVNDRLSTKQQFTAQFFVDGEVFSTQKVNKGGYLNKIEAPQKIGKKFEGWYVNDELWSFIGFQVNSNINLIAKYIDLVPANVETYNIDRFNYIHFDKISGYEGDVVTITVDENKKSEVLFITRQGYGYEEIFTYGEDETIKIPLVSGGNFLKAYTAEDGYGYTNFNIERKSLVNTEKTLKLSDITNDNSYFVDASNLRNRIKFRFSANGYATITEKDGNYVLKFNKLGKVILYTDIYLTTKKDKLVTTLVNEINIVETLPKTIEVLVQTADHGWTGAVQSYACEKVQSINQIGDYEVNLTACDTPSIEAEKIDQLIDPNNNKPDGIVLLPIDNTMETSLTRIVNANIPFVQFDRLIHTEVIDNAANRVSNVVGDNYGLGVLTARKFIELGIQPGADILIMPGDQSSVPVSRTMGFKDTLRNEGGWTDPQLNAIDSTDYTGWSRSWARRLFVSKGDGLLKYEWIFTHDSEIAMGVLEELKANNVSMEVKQHFQTNVKAIASSSGLDEMYAVLENQHRGEYASTYGNACLFDVTYDPAMIQIAIQDMVDYLDGKQVTKDHVIPSHVVTKDNVTQFKGFGSGNYRK